MSEPAPTDWASFWDQPNTIYVNARHFDVHYRDVANGIIAMLPHRGARVLDYGCGEATHAGRVAELTSELWLCEAAASVRDRLAQRFAGNPKIKPLSPEEAAQRPAGSLDLVVANSLVQYLSSEELDQLLAVWHRLLAPGGVLVIADVIPPNVGPLSDIMALLRYAARNGFLLAALTGLVRTIVSPYRKVRARLGIARYSADEFLAKLKANRFDAVRLAANLEHNPARMMFLARPR
jgi:SAM-dependent methyltransferase